MNSNELIEQVNNCRAINWHNSDLFRESELMLEQIADHLKTCERCRKQFDAQEYPQKRLINFEIEELVNTNLSDWICEA